jgi:hypothetical protein
LIVNLDSLKNIKKTLTFLLFSVSAFAQNQNAIFVKKTHDETFAHSEAYQNLIFYVKIWGLDFAVLFELQKP